MDKPYFIMMYSQDGSTAMPIIEENGDVTFFETEEEARELAKEHHFCFNFGYEIFEMGTGSF
jgi:hypothetical protein